MRISESFLQELRYRCRAPDVIGRYVNLKRAGRTQKGLCPFHNEKTPSFTVYEDTDSFYCFGCGAGGDVITFIRRIENLDYIEAVRFLAQMAGMDMPEDEGDRENARLRQRVLELNRETARLYFSNLASDAGREALDYLRRRRLSAETIRRFGLGFALNDGFSLPRYLREKGFTEEEMALAGMKKSKSGHFYDQFRGRVIFPIIDVRGNVIAFGGRKMREEDGGPKYLNSSDTLVFKKSRGLFALNIAKNHHDGRLILAEGYMDVIAMHQAGFQNAVATLGTALTEEQTRVMSRYAGEIIIAYDADGAGQKATMRAIEMLKELDVKVRVLKIPGAKDPDEFIRENGADKFKLLLEQSGSQVDYRIDRLRSEYDLTTGDGRIAFLGAFTGLLAGIDSLAEREVYADRVATELGIQKSAILADAEKYKQRQARRREKKQMQRLQTEIAGFNDKINPEKRLHLRAASAEEALLAALLSAPELADEVEKRIAPEEFLTSFNRRLYVAILEAVKAYGTFDLAMLGDAFSAEEMGKITKFTLDAARHAADLPEMEEYIAVIREEKSKESQADPRAMSLEELQNQIGHLAERKNRP